MSLHDSLVRRFRPPCPFPGPRQPPWPPPTSHRDSLVCSPSLPARQPPTSLHDSLVCRFRPSGPSLLLDNHHLYHQRVFMTRWWCSRSSPANKVNAAKANAGQRRGHYSSSRGMRGPNDMYVLSFGPYVYLFFLIL